MNVAIAVEHLSKRYRLGVMGGVSLNEELGRWWARVRGRPDPLTKVGVATAHAGREFWALRDVSFELKEGDVLGIVGSNGAGKSTLLKILSQVTAPTDGRVIVAGRIASLLEVGTGFHPDLSGRENIFLNGAILGMTKQEIRRNFDDIVEFAEIEEFVDTPVKRYSSGMYVRLAFAVAAHLDPEILIVDEVLAVGDAAFQRKCLGKMGEVAKGGRTVLFVSHNMGAIRSLCTSALALRAGTVFRHGDVNAVIADYLQSTRVHGDQGFIARNDERDFELTDVWLRDEDGNRVAAAQTGHAIEICLAVKTSQPVKAVHAGVSIHTLADDLRICLFYSRMTGDSLTVASGETVLVCAVPRVPLPPGTYSLTIDLVAGADSLMFTERACEISVVSGNFYGTGRLPESPWGGLVLVDHSWRTVQG
jgi:lipopolysaccharide transport system ATP-binding protein